MGIFVSGATVLYGQTYLYTMYSAHTFWYPQRFLMVLDGPFDYVHNYLCSATSQATFSSLEFLGSKEASAMSGSTFSCFLR